MTPFRRVVVSSSELVRVMMNPKEDCVWRCIECSRRFPAKPQVSAEGYARCAQCPDCGSPVTCWEEA